MLKTILIITALGFGGPHGHAAVRLHTTISRTTVRNVYRIAAVGCRARYVRVYLHHRSWLREHPRARYERVRLLCSIRAAHGVRGAYRAHKSDTSEAVEWEILIREDEPGSKYEPDESPTEVAEWTQLIAEDESGA